MAENPVLRVLVMEAKLLEMGPNAGAVEIDFDIADLRPMKGHSLTRVSVR